MRCNSSGRLAAPPSPPPRPGPETSDMVKSRDAVVFDAGGALMSQSQTQMGLKPSSSVSWHAACRGAVRAHSCWLQWHVRRKRPSRAVLHDMGCGQRPGFVRRQLPGLLAAGRWPLGAARGRSSLRPRRICTAYLGPCAVTDDEQSTLQAQAWHLARRCRRRRLLVFSSPLQLCSSQQPAAHRPPRAPTAHASCTARPVPPSAASTSSAAHGPRSSFLQRATSQGTGTHARCNPQNSCSLPTVSWTGLRFLSSCLVLSSPFSPPPALLAHSLPACCVVR